MNMHFLSMAQVKTLILFALHFFLLEERLKNSNLKQFNQGFDIIIEDTTFQMYSPNRSGQINHVKRPLNNDGIFIFTEKHSSEHDEYQKREIQKDYSFKQVDVDEDEEMLSVKYSVRGVPTVLVLDENDELITRIVGNIPKEQAKKMILGQ